MPWYKGENKRGAPAKSAIKKELFKKIGFIALFEIHLVTPDEYKTWYKNFMKDEFVEI